MPSLTWTVYDSTSGEILRRGRETVSTTHSGAGETQTADYGDPARQYYSGGTLTTRPASTASESATTVTADGTSTIQFSGLVSGDTITVTYEGVAIDEITAGGTTEDFTFDRPGTYYFIVRSFPKLDYEVMITAS